MDARGGPVAMGAAAILLVLGAQLAGCSPDLAPAGGPETAAPGWRTLERGLELGEFTVPDAGADGPIRVLRIDPAHFELRLLSASASDGPLLTARDWSLRHDLLAAINASMFQEDYRTSISLMRTREHVNNPRLTLHRAILAFDPLVEGLPPVRILDLECDRPEDWTARYGTLVQSIRMVSCRRENVWEQQARRSSAAAIGIDAQHRVLFVHVRAPFTTHDLIDRLLALPIGVERMMYAEGGPAAQLFVRTPEGAQQFVGVHETLLADDSQAWPVPNVIGVARRRPAAP